MIFRDLIVRDESEYEGVLLGENLDSDHRITFIVRITPHLHHIGIRVLFSIAPELIELLWIFIVVLVVQL